MMDIAPESIELAASFLERNSKEIISFAGDAIKRTKNNINIIIPNTYKNYISRSADKYGMAKSFFVREPTPIYNFYIPLSAAVGEKKLTKISFGAIEKESKRSIITAPAGSGKSMLMRHLFVSCIGTSKKVPIFIELRNYNSNDYSLIELINENLKEMGFSLGEEYVKKAISRGHFAILLDGYDEISISKRTKINKEISALSKAAGNCTIIVSSRPDDVFTGWDDFLSLEMAPLNIDEASELVKKIPFDADLKEKFLKDLKSTLFERHTSFLSNPLLLSIMLLTYGDSADIPNKLSVFYNQAYEALFQRHDAWKGGFQRDRRSNLDIQDFSRVFSAFCVHTYDRDRFQFSRVDALSFIENAKEAVNIKVKNSDFLDDSLQSTCLLIEDGLFLVFSHRSFQEYFVAKFMNETTSEKQKLLIDRFWQKMDFDNVINLLHEMNPDLVERHLIIPKLEELFNKIGVKNKVGITHYTKFMQLEFDHMQIDSGRRGIGPEAKKIRLSAAHIGPKIGFFRICRFISMNYIENDQIEKIFNSEKTNQFIKKYSKNKSNNIYKLELMTYRSPFMKDLAQSGGVFSLLFLQEVFRIKKIIEARHKNPTKRLEELLLS